MRLRLALLLPLAAVCFACAPPAARPAGPARPDPAMLRQELAALPGASLGAEEPLTVRYPGEVLFAAGAALPLPGGTAVLDPLAAWLAAHPELRWHGTVRAQTGVSPEYDQALAETRRELLGRYLGNRGVRQEQLSLTAAAGAGAPFELTLEPEAQPASPESSSPAKR